MTLNHKKSFVLLLMLHELLIGQKVAFAALVTGSLLLVIPDIELLGYSAWLVVLISYSAWLVMLLGYSAWQVVSCYYTDLE